MGNVMKRNYAIFTMIAAVIFVIQGAVILFSLTFSGPFQLRGVALAVGFGAWIVLTYLIGHKVYGQKKNLSQFLAFMIVALAIGLLYHFLWHLPYIRDHRNVAGVFEQICGIAWVSGFAAIYLAYQDYRRASE